MTNVNVFFFALLLGLLGMPEGAFGQFTIQNPNLPVTTEIIVYRESSESSFEELCPSSRGASCLASGSSLPLRLEQDRVLGETIIYKPFHLVLENMYPDFRIKVNPSYGSDGWIFNLIVNQISYELVVEEASVDYVSINNSEGSRVARFGFHPNSSDIHVTYMACDYELFTMLPCSELDPDYGKRLQGAPKSNGIIQTIITKKQSPPNDSPAFWSAVNPVSDNLVLTFDAPIPATTLVQVYNMNGGLVHREVVSADATQVTLTAVHWTPGIYAVSINQAGGSQQKLVVKQ